ncbi:MAG: glycosyltransferase family 4 protein [Planctomycetota bacterium]
MSQPAGKRALPTAASRDSEALRDSRGVTLRGVAVLAPGYERAGGPGSHARALARGLTRLGVPVTYLCPAPEPRPARLRETLGLIDLYRIPLPAAGLGGEALRLDLFELAALGILRLNARRLNLIYAVRPDLGALAARAGQALGIPVVIKLASSGPWGEVQSIGRDPDRDRLLAGLRGAVRIVAPREQVAREVRERLGVAPDLVARLPDGVDLAKFKPRPWSASLPPRVVFLGPLDGDSRLEVALEAFAAASEDPEAPAGLELIVAGDGPRRGAFEEVARSLGISGRTRFVGTEGDPVELLRDARVFVQPGPLGPGDAVLEALATGVAVVAADLPGTDELIDHDRTGLLTSPDDPAALAAAILRALGDDALHQRLVESAQRQAEDYELERCAAQHVELFEALAVARDERPTQPEPAVDLKRDAPLALATARAGLHTARSALGRLAGRLAGR